MPESKEYETNLNDKLVMINGINMEDFLKESLGSIEYPYDANAWDKIQAKLPAAKTPVPPATTKWAWVAGVAAVIAIASWFVSDMYRTQTNEGTNTTITKETNETPQGVVIINTDEKEAETSDNELLTTQANDSDQLLQISEPTKTVKTAEKEIVTASEKEVTRKEPEKQKQSLNVTTKPTEKTIVREKTGPDASFTADNTSGCGQLQVQFYARNAPENASYLWNFGDGNTSTKPNPQNFYAEAGRYSVSLTLTDNESGNSSTEFRKGLITVHEKPEASFSHKATGFNKVQFVNLSKRAATSVWSFGDGHSSSVTNPEHAYAIPGDYSITLTVESFGNCFDSYSQTINVESVEAFFMPNAFTPNGDNVNDFFGPIGDYLQELVDFKMMIYDKSGLLIFETTDVNNPWNGNIRNSSEPARQDVYTWVVVSKNNKGETKKHAGTVNLLR